MSSKRFQVSFLDISTEAPAVDEMVPHCARSPQRTYNVFKPIERALRMVTIADELQYIIPHICEHSFLRVNREDT